MTFGRWDSSSKHLENVPSYLGNCHESDLAVKPRGQFGGNSNHWSSTIATSQNGSKPQLLQSKLLLKNGPATRCLKSTEKVSFNIASEASYVYILSAQKLIKNAIRVNFGEFLKTWSLRSNSVTRHVIFNRTKIGKMSKNSNATFWVIFKQSVPLFNLPFSE